MIYGKRRWRIDKSKDVIVYILQIIFLLLEYPSFSENQTTIKNTPNKNADKFSADWKWDVVNFIYRLYLSGDCIYKRNNPRASCLEINSSNEHLLIFPATQMVWTSNHLSSRKCQKSVQHTGKKNLEIHHDATHFETSKNSLLWAY